MNSRETKKSKPNNAGNGKAKALPGRPMLNPAESPAPAYAPPPTRHTPHATRPAIHPRPCTPLVPSASPGAAVQAWMCARGGMRSTPPVPYLRQTSGRSSAPTASSHEYFVLCPYVASVATQSPCLQGFPLIVGSGMSSLRGVCMGSEAAISPTPIRTPPKDPKGCEYSQGWGSGPLHGCGDIRGIGCRRSYTNINPFVTATYATIVDSTPVYMIRKS